MVTLLVVTCAPVVVWTAVLPLRVVLGAIVHDPLASVTELPATAQFERPPRSP